MRTALQQIPRELVDNPPAWAVELAEGQRRIEAELRELRSDLRRDKATLSLSRADRAVLARLLPAIAGAVGSELHMVRELLAYPAVRLVTGNLTTRQIGKLFRRAEGQPISDYVIRSSGSEAGTLLWHVEKVVGFHPPHPQ